VAWLLRAGMGVFMEMTRHHIVMAQGYVFTSPLQIDCILHEQLRIAFESRDL
jgi:hypothetical protein